jgi:hypothetical protein
MKKKDLFRAIITEMVQKNLAEMPQIKKFYTLTDDWEQNLENIEGLRNSPKYRDIKTKMTTFRNKDYFNTDDIQTAFGFSRPQGANGFLKMLTDNGVVMRTTGTSKKPEINNTADVDDEWNLTVDPDSDLFGEIDIDSALSKISLDKNYRTLDFIWTIKTPYQKLLAHKFRTTRYRFLKPFLEGGYYKDIPSNEIVKLIQPSRWGNPELNVLDLFPSQEAFYKFLQENPGVIQRPDMRGGSIPPPNPLNNITVKALRG